jgi:magnesium chelatase family protein
VTKYQKRISGPLLDRIDIHIEVPRVDYEKLSGDRIGESSESIRARVQAARDIQLKRFSQSGSSDIVCNADMRIGEIRQFCKLQAEGQSPRRSAMSQLNLSARAYHGILKLARTIADLAGLEKALREEGENEVELAIRRILLIHGIILTVGGIPLIYLGDEIGTLNDYTSATTCPRTR